ncbi:GNAT family N-acetyltransferase [Candidatus Woesearchaeota archaeon]|nr:GNAT family N-acetyltransferase [Candidatus Woesearchaeota archaeon]
MGIDNLVDVAYASKPVLTFDVKEEGRVIASAQLYVMESEKGEYGRIENVFVDPECRGVGIGTVLSKHILEKSRQLGHYKCTLSSSKPNAQRIYENLGFRKHGESYRIDFTTEDSL